MQHDANNALLLALTFEISAKKKMNKDCQPLSGKLKGVYTIMYRLIHRTYILQRNLEVQCCVFVILVQHEQCSQHVIGLTNSTIIPKIDPLVRIHKNKQFLGWPFTWLLLETLCIKTSDYLQVNGICDPNNY